MTTSARSQHRVGEVLRVEVEKVAHGGHFIARHNGAVFFIRYAIPGEVVDIEITAIEKSFYHADVVAVIEPSPHRQSPPCRHFGAGLCGGCDFQHIDIAHQRTLKSDVVAEQFARIAKMEVDVEVQEVSHPLHWRTRFAASVNANGAAGFKAHRSGEIIPIDSCPVLLPEIDFPTLPESALQSEHRIEVALSTSGERTITTEAVRDNRTASRNKASIVEGKNILHYEVRETKYEVSNTSFWQSNVAAPTALVDAVLEMSEPQAGEHFLDLYGGVGLFSGALIPHLGPGGRIDIVEGSESACADARRNYADLPHISVHQGDVEKIIKKFKRADVVVLDPPRTGAGKNVIAHCSKLSARAIVYVACDPAALARDTGYLRENGYYLHALRAFDLFPQTHHVESIALYLPHEVS